MRRLAVVALFGLTGLLAGCFSLPPADPTTRAVVGQPAPAFELPCTDPGTENPVRTKVSLATLTSGTSLVVVFYRGHW